MNEVKELTVTVKGDEQTYKQKFLIYEALCMDGEDPIIKKYVDEALSNSKIEPTDIKVRALLVMR